jgi:hypothetical protein
MPRYKSKNDALESDNAALKTEVKNLLDRDQMNRVVCGGERRAAPGEGPGTCAHRDIVTCGQADGCKAGKY